MSKKAERESERAKEKEMGRERNREKRRKRGRGKRNSERSSRAQHVTGVVNISLAFVLRRSTDVPGFIYVLRYTPVQPVVGFLLLTRRSYM